MTDDLPTSETDPESAADRTGAGPIICGVDGSRNARRALDLALTLAHATGAEIIAVHALGLMSEVDGQHVPSREHREEIEHRLRAEWCEQLTSAGDVRWTCRLVDGNPADVLLHTADDTGASFIIVGARGIGGHPDLMLGSTSHQVIHRAHCPTVVVPPVDRPSSTVRESV